MDIEKVLAEVIYGIGEAYVQKKGEYKINKMFFPVWKYEERRELVEGQGKVHVVDNERRLKDLEESGRTNRRINSNLNIFDSIELVGTLTEDNAMLNKLNATRANCKEIVISKIYDLIKSGKAQFGEEIYDSEIIEYWKEFRDEEREVYAQIDTETSILCEKILDSYHDDYDKVKGMDFSDDKDMACRVEKLIIPEEIFGIASNNQGQEACE